MTATTVAEPALSAREWRACVRIHEERVRPWVQPRLVRRAKGESHPVDDFLFTYYSYRPAQLLAWHPGLYVVCELDDQEHPFTGRGYRHIDDGIAVDPMAFAERRSIAGQIHTLLSRTSDRPATFGCFGLHEWAMVYRLPSDEVRHASWPLRLTPDEIATTVETIGPRCTHFDAFRFFTEAARPLNPRQLTRDNQPEFEQPGCLHATMDLYKWAYKLSPLTSSELVADCFELAREVRTVDMQASPYDLGHLGVEPIAIETPEGRAEYVARQRKFAERGQRLRVRLLAEVSAIVDALS